MTNNQYTGSDLYPLVDGFNCVVTDRITNMTDMTSDWTDAYWLGYIKYNKLPYIYKQTWWTTDDGSIVFQDVTKHTNYDIGYAIGGTDNSYPAMLLYNGTTLRWQGWDNQWSNVATNSTNIRLLNQVDINQSTVTSVILIWAINVKDTNNIPQTYTMGFTIIPVADMIAGTFSATMSTNDGNLVHFGGISGRYNLPSLTISQSDVNGTVNTQNIDDYTVEYCCCGIELVNANGRSTTGFELNQPFVIKPIVKLQNDLIDLSYPMVSLNDCSGFGFQYYCGEGLAYNATAGVIWLYEQNNIAQPKPYSAGEYANLIAGNYVGSFRIDSVRTLFTSGSYGFYYETGCNFVLQSTGSQARVMIRRFVTYDEIMSIIALYPRLGTTNTYDNGSDKWYALVDDDNQFTTKLANGQDDYAKLKTWQLIGQSISPTSAPYRESDKPDWSDDDDPETEPTPDGKGEPKITGDLISGSYTRFGGSGSTYYALTPDEMDGFRNTLWNQPNSFYEQLSMLAQTSIFDYITSVRYYPLSYLGFTTDLRNVYLGTGAAFKNTDDSYYQLNAIMSGTLTTVHIGDWNFATYDFWRHNFLDYSPYCKISIYLPYCGTYDIETQQIAAYTDISSAQLSLYATIDVETGTLTYKLETSGSLLLSQSTKLAIDLPLTGNDSIAQSARMITATGNLVTKTVGGTLSTIANPSSGLAAAIGVGDAAVDTSLAAKQIPVTVSSFGGYMSNVFVGQQPYVTIYRQKIANPSNFGHVTGYLTRSSHVIDDLSGFTVCNNVDTSSIVATADELTELKTILESGFYA